MLYVNLCLILVVERNDTLRAITFARSAMEVAMELFSVAKLTSIVGIKLLRPTFT